MSELNLCTSPHVHVHSTRLISTLQAYLSASDGKNVKGSKAKTESVKGGDLVSFNETLTLSMPADLTQVSVGCRQRCRVPCSTTRRCHICTTPHVELVYITLLSHLYCAKRSLAVATSSSLIRADAVAIFTVIISQPQHENTHLPPHLPWAKPYAMAAHRLRATR